MKSEIRRKRISKKSKSSWRKHSNIADVNEFLEKKLQEERIGDVSIVPSEELYVLDNKAEPKLLISSRQRRRRPNVKGLTSLAALENSSKVADPIQKRNHVRLQQDRKHFKEKVLQKSYIEKKTQNLLKNYKPNLEKKPKSLSTSHDIWSVQEEPPAKLNSQWINKVVTTHNLRNIGYINYAAPKTTHHSSSQLGAISIPHPGTSYNPSLEDHQDLMKNVLDEESKIIKKEEHINRVTTNMFEKKTVEERDEEKLKELQPESESECEENDDNDLTSINGPISVKRKSGTSKRKQWEQNEIKQNLLKMKLEKKKITDIHRLKFLNDNIMKEEAKLDIAKHRKKIVRVIRKAEPRRISKQKFKEQDIEIALPQEISGNLRNVKVGEGIMKDRFKSMQRRNILAPTVDIGLRRRREVKRFTRNSHKEVQEPLKNKKKSIKLLS